MKILEFVFRPIHHSSRWEMMLYGLAGSVGTFAMIGQYRAAILMAAVLVGGIIIAGVAFFASRINKLDWWPQ